jgi:hypothetical protein
MRYVLYGIIYACLLTTIQASTIANSDVAKTEDYYRNEGGVVIIKGIERPDLVERFDFLKKNTIMHNGVVYAKADDGSIILPDNVAQEIKDHFEREAELDQERERRLLSKSQSQPCPKCPACGSKPPCNTYSCTKHGYTAYDCIYNCVSCALDKQNQNN